MADPSRVNQLANKENFNLEDALKEGYSVEEINDYLTMKETQQDKYLELLLCPPKYMSADIPNNRWMKDLDEEERKVNIDLAMAQFFQTYSLFSQDALVYLLPPKKGLQDQVYITNAGMVLPHLYKTVILSNFKAEGRPGEEEELSKFMNLMRYQQFKCPFFFEGEAEMKWIRDNIYIGGYGQRTDIRAFEWMEANFGCRIIKMKETDTKRYHLDCNVFSISREQVLVAKDQLDPTSLKQLEAVAEIIPVTRKSSQWSITNSIRIGSIIYNGTDIDELKRSDRENYDAEKEKNEELERICRDLGLALVLLNLSEFSKSGAALSCMILHLSYIAYPA
jgi:N-dimethylarginine dimethylaminohydrolase